MRQLFFNLIGNSLKFIQPNQKVIIEVSGDLVKNTSGDGKIGSWYELRVSDNGVGFDEKYLDRIFQPFQRLHSPAIYEGNGMGLAICRKIVERHGGDITAKSSPGQGAIFIVRLPVLNGEGNKI
jgi:signal transduction histidine kinase